MPGPGTRPFAREGESDRQDQTRQLVEEQCWSEHDEGPKSVVYQNREQAVPQREVEPFRRIGLLPAKGKRGRPRTAVVVGLCVRHRHQSVAQGSKPHAQLQVLEEEEDQLIKPPGLKHRPTLHQKTPTGNGPHRDGVGRQRIAQPLVAVAEGQCAHEVELGPVGLDDLTLWMEMDARTCRHRTPLALGSEQVADAIPFEIDVMIHQEDQVRRRQTQSGIASRSRSNVGFEPEQRYRREPLHNARRTVILRRGIHNDDSSQRDGLILERRYRVEQPGAAIMGDDYSRYGRIWWYTASARSAARSQVRVSWAYVRALAPRRLASAGFRSK